MKTFFVPARYTGEIKFDDRIISKLPDKIGIVSTAQFLNQIDKVKEILEKSGKNVFIGKSLQGNNAQLLGCDVSSAQVIDDKIDAFLYIGSGEFHPRGVGLKTEKDIFSFNPITEEFRKLPRDEIGLYKKKKKAAYIKFLSSRNIGIIVSTKQGQNNLIRALELKKNSKDKKFYVFVSETIDFSQLENFPFIECWVNSACPRIDEDLVCLNLNEVEEIVKNKQN